MSEYRNTIQRQLVLNAVSELKGAHPTAEEVYNHLYNKYPTVSKSTVYRNLNILIKQGEILRVEVPCGADRMDANINLHYHICCENCGRVDDIKMSYIDNIRNIQDTSGYVVNSCKIVFTGLCPICNKN